MNTLILKLNATGDVVRTTTLLRRLPDEVTWVTAATNSVLLNGLAENLRCIAWEDRKRAAGAQYDAVINLEDEPEVAAFLKTVRYKELCGAYLDENESMAYTDSSRPWFDLSLISRHGRVRADLLKLQNRRTYQDLVFRSFGWRFSGEQYLLPVVRSRPLGGDVAISPLAGSVWPMKNWAYYGELKRELEAAGLEVNVLPHRSSLLEHLADIRGHRCLVSGDSLPMHLALGSGVPCVTLFNCTSPWEIYGYGLQTKIVSPLLNKYFYQRGYDHAAVSAISLSEVYEAVIDVLDKARTSPVLAGRTPSETVASLDCSSIRSVLSSEALSRRGLPS
jgi:hypothetical protein